jgi:hypothetical protein
MGAARHGLDVSSNSHQVQQEMNRWIFAHLDSVIHLTAKEHEILC